MVFLIPIACSSSRHAKIGMGVGLGIAGAGGIVVTSGEPSTGPGDLIAGTGGAVFLGSLIAFALTSIVDDAMARPEQPSSEYHQDVTTYQPTELPAQSWDAAGNPIARDGGVIMERRRRAGPRRTCSSGSKPGARCPMAGATHRSRGAALSIVKFKLTSEHGKLSALTCTIDAAGAAHGLAIERHFGATRAR